MGLNDTELNGDEQEMQSSPSDADGKKLRSPAPPPGAQLGARERKVWDYICRVLREDGMPHLTAGIAIAVVCRTFIRWVDTEVRLADLEKTTGTYFVKTPNGFEQPHQFFYAAAALKKELLQWLPESCLTLPSTVIARAKLGDEGVQDDLFGDLLAHARAERNAARKPVAQKSTSTV